MKFLFWNVKKNPVGTILSEIVKHHEIDVVILAECPDPTAILIDLNSATETLFHLTDNQRTRVVIYTRFPREYTRTAHSDSYLTIRQMQLPRKSTILLAATHLPSRLFGNEDPSEIASRMAAKIYEVERETGISRTLLVGDLNMNPFDRGVVGANGFHAVMTRAIARKQRRVIRKESSLPFFYNPMWGRFGDTTEGPPGTYYRWGTSFNEYFWHTYDQVLIRPDLLDSFDEKSMHVLTECGEMKLVRKTGIPDQSRVSDHLPLLFALTT